jgi:hypothetical protein
MAEKVVDLENTLDFSSPLGGASHWVVSTPTEKLRQAHRIGVPADRLAMVDFLTQLTSYLADPHGELMVEKVGKKFRLVHAKPAPVATAK